jgi:hypothetical protein
MCHILGFQNINVVRDRPDIDTVKNELISLGANEVLTEEEVVPNLLFHSWSMSYFLYISIVFYSLKLTQRKTGTKLRGRPKQLVSAY